MAIITLVYGITGNGTVQAEIDYREIDLAVVKGRVRNGGVYKAEFWAKFDPPIAGYGSVSVPAAAGTVGEADWSDRLIRFVDDPEDPGSMYLPGVTTAFVYPAESQAAFATAYFQRFRVKKSDLGK